MPPDKYSGAADLQAFHHFLTQGTAYVKYGYVEKPRQIAVLSDFLTGRAYTFYTREVSMHPKGWTLDKFFTQLFNYCFPVDFRNKQRRHLEQCQQGNRSGRDYVADLTELFTIVGSYSKKERVVKLFNNFCPSIQKGLYVAKLHPETSRWKRVVSEAEYIEMAENIDLKIPSSSSHNGNGGGSGSSHGNSHGGNRNNRGYRRNGNDHRDRGHRSGNQSPRRPKSPSTFGKKTNNTPGYSSGPRYPKAGSSHSKPPHRRQGGPSTKKVQLSAKEEEDLCAAGKCFKCKEHGHMARNCPTNNSVKSSSSGKPLGLSSFSLGIDLQETERLRYAGLPERSGLSLGMVDIRGDSNSDDLEYLDPTEEGHPSGSDNAALDLFEDDFEFDDLPELMLVSDSDEEGPSYDTESDISDEQSDLSDSGLSTIDEYVEMENRASAEEDTPVLLVLTPSMQFAMYEGHIPHSSV